MAGFSLPKLRWLIVGAVAAGGWAMTQEPPKAPRPAKVETRQATSEKRAIREVRTHPPVRDRASPSATPNVATRPPSRPTSEMITSSIPRPPNPIGKAAEGPTLVTTSRVRLRKQAGTSGAVVTTLKAGQPVRMLAEDGAWRLVSVAGQKGWVHGDYIGAPQAPPIKTTTATAPRPSAPVARQPVVNVSGGDAWGAMRPIRAPQGGDCECPYDLMLSGKQCGDHSAFARKSASAEQCFF